MKEKVKEENEVHLFETFTARLAVAKLKLFSFRLYIFFCE